eukprot:767137-Hanusia_phi.AAC.4
MRLISMVGLLGMCWQVAAWRRSDELEALMQEAKSSETVTMSGENERRKVSSRSVAPVVISQRRKVRLSGLLFGGGGGGGGGGERSLHVDGGHLIAIDCVFEGYQAHAPIYVARGTLDCYNCSFLQNHNDGAGGAINAVNGSLNVVASLFQNNSARSGGGAIFVSGSSRINVSDSVFEHNSDGQGSACGGAIHVQDDDSTLVFLALPALSLRSDSRSQLFAERSKFWFNAARDGGAICLTTSNMSELLVFAREALAHKDVQIRSRSLR